MNALRWARDVYTRSYQKRPILTLCVTNGVLGVMSDSLAQAIAFRDTHPAKGKTPIHLDEHLPERLRRYEDQWPEEKRWDAARTARFALYNFCVAPIAGKWYIFLDRYFPMPAVAGATKTLFSKADGAVLKRMIADQALFAPAGLVVFFTTMGFIETRTWHGVKEKFEDAYVPALQANYAVWPLVQLINFKFMPLPFRLPFVSSLGILWNAYLSWLNNASKQTEKVHESLHHTL